MKKEITIEINKLEKIKNLSCFKNKNIKKHPKRNKNIGILFPARIIAITWIITVTINNGFLNFLFSKKIKI